MEININVGSDLKRVTRSLTMFAEKQIPFATARALNEIGAAVKANEKAEIKKEFPTATPFTLNSVGQQRARKSDPQTIVYLRDVAASYLEPYITQGRHKLNGRALLNPKNVALNQYGNLPRNKLASLRAKPGVFIGAVQTKSGKVNGVWQRLKAAKGKPSRLKLLIRFGDALPVKQTLEWGSTAQSTVASTFDKAFGRAMAFAIATARLK